MSIHQISDGEPSHWVSPVVLFDQYRAQVALVAAEADVQIEWMRTRPFVDREGAVHEGSVGSDEIRNELDDVRGTHEPRILRAGLLSSEGSQAVAGIESEFAAWADSTLWQSDDALRRPEWVAVRKTAASALSVLDAYTKRAE